MITDVGDARYEAKTHPGRLCAVNPDRPLATGQKAYLLPRGDVVFQQYIDLWLRQAQSDGMFQRVNQPPVERLTAAAPRSPAAAPR